MAKDSTDPLHSPGWCVEAWVATMALRSLGYPPEELFFGYELVHGFGRCIVVQLQRKLANGKPGTFTWTLQRLPDADYDQVCAQWQAFVEQMTTAPQPLREAVWASSRVVRDGGPNYFALGLQLRRCGFEVPELADLDKIHAEAPTPSLVCWLSESEWEHFYRLMQQFDGEQGTEACATAVMNAIAAAIGASSEEVVTRVTRPRARLEGVPRHAHQTMGAFAMNRRAFLAALVTAPVTPLPDTTGAWRVFLPNASGYRWASALTLNRFYGKLGNPYGVPPGVIFSNMEGLSLRTRLRIAEGRRRFFQT